MCHFAPKQPSDTLVVFLHGLTKVGTTWQHNGERTLVRGAKANGFEVLMPRGRRLTGSKFGSDYFNWPTSAKAQAELESEVLAEWDAAQKTLGSAQRQALREGLRLGLLGRRVLRVVPRSQGPLAGRGLRHLRGWRRAQGCLALGARERIPSLPSTWATEERTRAGRIPSVCRMSFALMHWPRKVVERKKLGHSMTDAQMREAWQFLEKTQPAK